MTTTSERQSQSVTLPLAGLALGAVVLLGVGMCVGRSYWLDARSAVGCDVCAQRVRGRSTRVQCPECGAVCHLGCFFEHIAACPSLLDQRMGEREEWRGHH